MEKMRPAMSTNQRFFDFAFKDWVVLVPSLLQALKTYRPGPSVSTVPSITKTSASWLQMNANEHKWSRPSAKKSLFRSICFCAGARLRRDVLEKLVGLKGRSMLSKGIKALHHSRSPKCLSKVFGENIGEYVRSWVAKYVMVRGWHLAPHRIRRQALIQWDNKTLESAQAKDKAVAGTAGILSFQTESCCFSTWPRLNRP